MRNVYNLCEFGINRSNLQCLFFSKKRAYVKWEVNVEVSAWVDAFGLGFNSMYSWDQFLIVFCYVYS